MAQKTKEGGTKNERGRHKNERGRHKNEMERRIISGKMNEAKGKKRDEGYRRNRNLSEFIGNNLHISKKSSKFAPDFKMHKYALMISRTPPSTSKGGERMRNGRPHNGQNKNGMGDRNREWETRIGNGISEYGMGYQNREWNISISIGLIHRLI